VWDTYETFSAFPNSLLFNATMVSSFSCGGVAAAIQLREEIRVRRGSPGRFDPGPYESFLEVRERRARTGESWLQASRQIAKLRKAAPDPAKLKATTSTAGYPASAPGGDKV
jgi:hypothetical protein